MPAKKTRTRAWSRAAKLPEPRLSVVRNDGWSNLLTGLGDPDRDKRYSSSISGIRLTYEDCVELWRSDDMAARIVEVPVEEMTREGYDLLVGDEDDKDVVEEITQQADDLELDDAVSEALENARAYGGGAIFIGANDGEKDLRKPLNVDRLKSIDYLTTLKPKECAGITYYADPAAPKFGQTSIYRLQPELAAGSAVFTSFVEVHESRVIKFQGNVVSRRQLRENFGWGDPVFVRIFEVIRDFQNAFGGSAALLGDFSQAVFAISGLREMLKADDGSNRLRNRLKAMDMARSMIRALILDAGDASGNGKESFERKATPLTGYAELLDRWGQRMASAADMPVERLLGETTKGGMGQGGSTKIEWWEKHIGNLQRKKMRKQLRYLYKLLFLCKDGPAGGEEPDTWRIQFRPLSQLSPVEESQRRLNIAQADSIYMQAGAVTPEEIAQSHFGGDEYSIEINLDTDMRDDYDDAVERKNESTIGEPEKSDPQTLGQQTGMPMKPGDMTALGPDGKPMAEQNMPGPGVPGPKPSAPPAPKKKPKAET